MLYSSPAPSSAPTTMLCRCGTIGRRPHRHYVPRRLRIPDLLLHILPFDRQTMHGYWRWWGWCPSRPHRQHVWCVSFLTPSCRRRAADRSNTWHSALAWLRRNVGSIQTLWEQSSLNFDSIKCSVGGEVPTANYRYRRRQCGGGRRGGGGESIVLCFVAGILISAMGEMERWRILFADRFVKLAKR